jgi:dihydroflavonol-4-reductase
MFRNRFINPGDIDAGCRQVYHLAANPHLWTQRRGDFHRVNYFGTQVVLDAALDANVDLILHTSTESILTRAGPGTRSAENHIIRARDVIGPYCRSKFLAERYALHLARAGAPIVVVNPTLPVGPGDWGCSPPTRMMLDFCRGKRREYLDAELNLIDVRDVALGMVSAMDRAKTGKRYLLGHENLSVRTVFDMLAQITGLPTPTRRVPYPLAIAAAYVGELFADVVTHRAPAATVTGVKLTRRRMHFDARPSLQELGIKPRPVVQSIRDAVDWFRTSGMLKTPMR